MLFISYFYYELNKLNGFYTAGNPVGFFQASLVFRTLFVLRMMGLLSL